MPFARRRIVRTVRSTLRHPNAAFQDKRGDFTKTLRTRMNPKWWPFNAPRPQRRDGRQTPVPVASTTVGEIAACVSSHTIEEYFDGFDGQHANPRLDTEETEASPLSWRKTPSSKIRQVKEPTPKTPTLESIDTVIIKPLFSERPSPSIPKIPTISQQEWENNYQLARNLIPAVVKKIKVHRAPPMEAVIMEHHLEKHCNIVYKLGMFYDPGPRTCNIIMEYCSGGDLFDFVDHWLYKRTQQIPEMFLLHFIASMGEALGYLHLGRRLVPAEAGVGMPSIVEDKKHRAVLHRDIKLENIFLRWSPSNQHGLPDIVLGDFGGAVLEAQSSGGCFGTSGYFPPEVLRYMESSESSGPSTPDRSTEAVMTKASDVYTFGTCFGYMMLWGDFTPGMDLHAAFQKSNLRGWPLLLDLLQSCLADEPSSRPSTETLLNWAPVFNLHVTYLYEHGVRMPVDSWPCPPPIAHTASTEALHRPSSGDAHGTENISTFDPCPSDLVKLPGRSLSTVYDEPIPASSKSDPDHGLRQPGRSRSVVLDDSECYDPVLQMALPVRFAKPSTPPKAVQIQMPKRISSLFDIVERLANNLVGSVPGYRISKAFAGSKLGRRLSGRGQLVSKFSDDSDSGVD